MENNMPNEERMRFNYGDCLALELRLYNTCYAIHTHSSKPGNRDRHDTVSELPQACASKDAKAIIVTAFLETRSWGWIHGP